MQGIAMEMVIYFMRRLMFSSAIVFCMAILSFYCCAADLAGNESNAALQNGTVGAIGSANNTTNSTNSSLDSAIGHLNSTINDSADKSGLWSWGDVPEGYVRKDGKIVSKTSSESDQSVMETPSQSSPNNYNAGNKDGGLLVRPE